jgi:hypothetical protein
VFGPPFTDELVDESFPPVFAAAAARRTNRLLFFDVDKDDEFSDDEIDVNEIDDPIYCDQVRSQVPDEGNANAAAP